jgi:hypothetical protein
MRGYSKTVISENVKKLKSRKQKTHKTAVAIAMRKAGKSKPKTSSY